MARKLSEQELLDLETEYWQAIRDKDADAAIRLSDQPCIITGAQGIRRIEGETLRNLIKTTLYTLHDVRLSDVQVHALEDDVAIVAYNVHEELTVEGKPVSLDATDTSTWVRRDGRWLCAVHTESLKGDPFGRDRA
jgi:ketosteroid isomerase-like protein